MPPPSTAIVPQATPSYRRCGVAAALGILGTGARDAGSVSSWPVLLFRVGNLEYSPSQETVNPEPLLLGMSDRGRGRGRPLPPNGLTLCVDTPWHVSVALSFLIFTSASEGSE